MAWVTYNESDDIARSEYHAQEWPAPDLITPEAGTIEAGLDPDPSFAVVGAGTDFTTIDDGCYIFSNENVFLVKSVTDATNLTSGSRVLIPAGATFYTLGEQDGEKAVRKMNAIDTAFAILSKLPGYAFPNDIEDEMRTANALLAFDIFSGAYASGPGRDRTIKREKIGDFEQEYFNQTDTGATGPADALNLPARVRQCLAGYASANFGGVLCPEPDFGS